MSASMRLTTLLVITVWVSSEKPLIAVTITTTTATALTTPISMPIDLETSRSIRRTKPVASAVAGSAKASKAALISRG